MYTKSHIVAKEAEEEEKLTKSLEAEFQVSFTNWVSDARKIQWKEDKVCVCVTVLNSATRFKPLLKKKVEPLSRILGKPALGGSQKAESGSSGV